MSLQRNSATRSFLRVILLLVLLILSVACSKDKPQSPKPQKETREHNQDPQAAVKEKGAEPAELSDSRHPVELPKVTFIELGSIKCVPCRMMQEVMQEIELEFKDQVRIVFHDVWTPEGKPYSDMYGIRVIPTQVFLDKEGKEYFRHEGYFPKEELVKVLRQKGVR